MEMETKLNISEVYKTLGDKELEFNKRLENILGRQDTIENRMHNIGRSLSGLKIVVNDSKKLTEMIISTSNLAENVSAKVRRLDKARSRVSECQQRVHDLIDLQLCSHGVKSAIKDEDFEKAAAHINRFLSMDQNLLQKTADDVSGSVTSVSQAVKTLEEACVQIRLVVYQKFDEAVTKDDLASVERFFKIFPLLGLHREGIEKFCNYICAKLRTKSQKELRNSLDIAKAEKRMNVAYADSLTVLFENIARVIEINQPIVETYYGYGHLGFMVIILQRECDDEILNLLNEFNKNRLIRRRVQQINDYIKGGGHNQIGHYRNKSGSTDKLNAREIDALIGEITIMHSRADLYTKFIRRRVTNDYENLKCDNADEIKKNMEDFVENIKKSKFSRQMQELLGNYILFERYFMEENVLKAISLDTYENGQQSSSMVDDIFFIIKKCIRRSIATNSLDGTCAVINNAATCLENDFLTALKTPLKKGYPSGYMDLAQAYSAFQTSLQQGRLQTTDSEASKVNFIVQLNNADLSTEYIETLLTAITEEINLSFPAMSIKEKSLLDSCLSGIKTVGDSLRAIIDFGMEQLRSSAIKPRLDPWVDKFLTYNHTLTDDELQTYEAGETFIQYMIVQIDGLLNSFKTVLSTRNYDALVGIFATDITARFEYVIRKSTFNRLGGLVLDQEVRALGSYLTGATSWSVRDKLARLTQIATLLNLEKVTELNDYWNPTENGKYMTWRITPKDARFILSLRTDFRLDDIKRLKL